MDKCIDSLGKATVFSTFDANNWYWQVEIDEKQRDKTAFTTQHGLYRFIRMSFVFRNAPGTFQRKMDGILSSVNWQFALVYLDDIVTFSKSDEQNIDFVRKVLTLPQNTGVTLKLKKCRFFTENIYHLGYLILRERLEIAPHTADATRGLQALTNLTELRLFLGLCNVF